VYFFVGNYREVSDLGFVQYESQESACGASISDVIDHVTDTGL